MARPAAPFAAALVAALALLAAPALPGAAGGRALAHAQLVTSSPGAGVSVPATPEELRLVFSEPLERQLTSLDLATAEGAVVVERAGTVDPDDPFALVLRSPDLPQLDDGVYTVTWRTLSAADGHTAEGTFGFAVGAATVPVGQEGGGMTHAEASPIDVLGRWLSYLGLLLALGVAVGHAVVLRTGPMSLPLRRSLAACLALAGSATLVLAVSNALDTGTVADYLLASRNGQLYLVRAVVAFAGAGLLLAVPPRRTGATAGATGLLGVVLLVMAGHAAALPGPVPILAQAVHVVGAAVWFGGLALLLTLLVRPRLALAGTPPPMRQLVPRFSALALVSIGLVGLTGVYAAWSQTGTVLDLGTEYGQTLVRKTILALVAMALGGLNFLDGGRMRSWLQGMRTRLSVEVGIVVLVLFVTAALATTPPTDEAGGVPIEPVPDAFGRTTPGMTLTLGPGRPGTNRVTVTTTDAMAMTSGRLELVLDRLDTGTTTRAGLRLVTPHGEMDHGAEPHGSDSPVDWVADAVVLPAGSRWDANVMVLSTADAELARQRFAFGLSDDGVDEGRIGSFVDPATVVAAVLLGGGALGLGIGIGGGRLPRTDAASSRLALAVGGSTAVLLGLAIGIDRLLLP